uniref:Uncharacterized protein n=1 Tax=Knipowitschia caucasica TaxID=637954 RepID=A0AAV2JJM2_KNICA
MQGDGWKERLIHWATVLFRVGLWLALAWALSHLHFSAPCFLLPMLMWLYSVPLKVLFSRTKRGPHNRHHNRNRHNRNRHKNKDH